MAKKKVSLMTWMAIERDPNLFDNVLYAAKDLYDIEHIYYLYTNGEKTRTEILVQNLRFMERKYKPLLEPIPIDINNPSSLEELLEKVHDTLEPRLKTMGDLIISTTAGTPAMYATWILLFKSAFFPQGTILFSAQRDLKKGKELFENKAIVREPSQKLQRINVKINTFLSRIKDFEAKLDPSEQKFKYEVPKSPKAQKVHENILRFAQVPRAPLLIYGERGVGKSTAVNKWIRCLKSAIKDPNVKNSKNLLVPIVTINCSSLDPNLAESIIFGYVDGAFTNARKGGMEGLIEKARDGILFLDEVQDLKKDVQRKLLRVLNEHRYTKFGDTSNEEIEIHFDLVCATNKTEWELKQRLDLDFYDRICVYKVTFPPLRERREDIPDLWRDTWRDVCFCTGHEELAAEGYNSDELNRYFSDKKNKLYGNIRSLRKIAFLKIAWMGEKNDKEILDMIEEDESDAIIDTLSQNSSFSKYESMPWNEANAQFRKDLAQWALHKYGSLSKAEESLGWKKRNLQNALRGEEE